MSYIFSRALAGEFLGASCLGIDAYVQSKSTHTHRPSSSPDKTTEHSRLSRYGMTCEHLPESRGEELLMSLLADFRAKTSVLLEQKRGLKDHAADSGERCFASFAKYDQSSSSWKTPQCSLAGDYTEFSGIWPRQGMMRNGVCSERPTPELHTEGNECGFWPTPTVCGNHNRKIQGKKSGDGLATAVRRRALERLNFQHGQETPPMPLNPQWIEWLMGWPIGHTELKPLETDKYLEWQRQHSPFLGEDYAQT